jgi:6-phosphogluconate dehydrogenase (decarboxylating)
MELGVIGLGRMGQIVVERALAAGHTVVAYDRDPAAVKTVRPDRRVPYGPAQRGEERCVDSAIVKLLYISYLFTPGDQDNA